MRTDAKITQSCIGVSKYCYSHQNLKKTSLRLCMDKSPVVYDLAEYQHLLVQVSLPVQRTESSEDPLPL